MKSRIFIFGVFLAYFGVMRLADAAQKAPSMFSTYGEIQPVQKYSSNPFWNKDSPYNQRMPTPIYATGADLNTGDCNRVVANLIASFCASNNNCANKKISDVRPQVMVQLSQLPGHNFATSCSGYIDSEFENYKKTYGNVSQNNIIKPVVTTQQTQPVIKTDNLFKQQPGKYEQGVAERTAELKRLQNANTPTPTVSPQAFPKTIDDISFNDRMALASAGYEPYQNLKSYKVPNFEEEDEEFFARLKAINPTKYCERRPSDSFCNPASTTTTTTQGGGGGGGSNGNEPPAPELPPCDNPGSSADCPIVLTLN